MLRFLLLLAHCVCQLPSVASAQWRQSQTPPSPPARIIPAITEDPVTGRLVLFGGDRMRSTPIGDTWEWDGTRWFRADSTGPGARYGHSMAPFPGLGGILLFGGYNKRDTLHNDLWLRRASSWTRLEPAGPVPAPRRSAAVAFDPVRNRLVVNGGFGGMPRATPSQDNHFLTDTWEFDGRAWSKVADSGPEGRYGASMAYDPEWRVMVLFGGNDHSNNIYGDTWTWDGRAWNRISTSGPPPRGGGLFYWDPARRSLLMIGGFAGRETFTDTWAWNGATWTRLDVPAVPSLVFPMLAWHSATRSPVLVGQAAGGDSVVQTWTRP